MTQSVILHGEPGSLREVPRLFFLANQALAVALSAGFSWAAVMRPLAMVPPPLAGWQSMDEIVISAGMPRTLYRNDDVTPDAHRLRALRGPMYSVIRLSSGLAIQALAPLNSI